MLKLRGCLGKGSRQNKLKVWLHNLSLNSMQINGYEYAVTHTLFEKTEYLQKMKPRSIKGSAWSTLGSSVKTHNTTQSKYINNIQRKTI